MIVDELLRLLLKAKAKKRSHWPVQLMVIQDGVTYAQNITGGEIANVKNDGERVWLYPEEGIILPDWSRLFKS